jgi:DNA-binding transcriptional LysR family regulator
MIAATISSDWPMLNVDLKKLRAFQMVVRHGGLRGAADHLHVTTSAVSFQLKNLEEELGVTLFDRANKRFTLTPQGRSFLDDVDRILADVDRAIGTLTEAKKPRSRVSLGIGFDLTSHFAGAIAGFMQANPHVDLSLRLRPTQDILRYMMDGEIDIGIGHFNQLPSQIVKRPLIKSGFFALCPSSHPFGRLKRPTLGQLAEHAIVMPRQDNSMGRQILGCFAAQGLQPASVIEAGSCQSSYNLAKEGIGVAIIHTTCLATPHARNLKILDVTEHFGEIDIVVAYPKRLKLTTTHSDLVQALGGTAS